MKTFLVIGGYARSAKTTALNFLHNQFHFPIYSTSQLLDKAVDTLDDLYGYEYCGSREYGCNTSIMNLDTVQLRRQEKIKLAEEFLVPVFGREVLALTVARKAIADTAPIVVLESIGGEEWEMTENYIRDNCTGYRIYRINIRREEEQKGIDIRELLPFAFKVVNDGSIHDLEVNLTNIIAALGLDHAN